MPTALHRLVTASADIAATRSRTAKRRFIARALADTDPADIQLAVTYLSGRLAQRRTGVGWASLTSVPEPAAEPSLTLREVDATFGEMSALSGGGSAARRAAAVEELFGRATAAEQRFLRGLVFDELRQGALDSLVQDGLAEAFEVPLDGVRRASMLLGSTAAAAGVLVRDGAHGLEAVRLRVGQPVRPMLAASAPEPVGALAKSGVPAVVDAKLDGIRVQVHRSGQDVRVFTRSLDDITDRVPEIVAVARGLPVQTVVLDGEAVSIGPDGRPLAFQEIAARAATHVDSVPDVAGAPLRLFCFDLLEVDGRDLLDQPLHRRVEVMREVLPPQVMVPRHTAQTLAELEQIFTDAVASGYEGVVVKKLNAPYAAGRRDSGWVKLKPRHTFDLAVTAAEWGYGRREGWLSNLHLAARDPATGELVMLGKTFKGMTDEMLRWQTAEFQARAARRTRTTVHIDPPLVVEIAIDGVQASVRYPGGIALRFARVVRYRPEKSVDEVDTVETVRTLGGLGRSGETEIPDSSSRSTRDPAEPAVTQSAAPGHAATSAVAEHP